VAFVQWGQSLVDGMDRRSVLRRWTKPKTAPSADTKGWTRGYLVDGRHSNAYVTEGHCARLASTIDEELRTARVYGAFT
jgi:hypothetical protein